jgi:hypothetical protein
MDAPGQTDVERRLGRQILQGLQTGTLKISYVEVHQPIVARPNPLPAIPVHEYDLRVRRNNEQ